MRNSKKICRIDWGKIHQINEKQHHKPSSNAEETRKGEVPGDNQADQPASGQTVGDLFVIQDPDGTLVTTTSDGVKIIDLLGAYNLFRVTNGDYYDFITFYIDINSGMPDRGNASYFIFNDVKGIGWGGEDSRTVFNSTKLLRMIYHSWFSLRTLIHEPAHQWSFYVNYQDVQNGPFQFLLHEDFPDNQGQKDYHWGRWPDNDNSCMDYDRCDWIDNGNGTYNRVLHNENSAGEEDWFGYHPLDLYLMGFIPATEVPDFTVVQNPSPYLSYPDVSSGPHTPSPNAVTVGIENIQFAQGVRDPDYLGSQRVFHQAVIVITKSSSTNVPFIADSETWRSRHTANFRRATGGRAMVDTSLLKDNYTGLYFQDNDNDVGGKTSGGIFWLSPDLWIRNQDDGQTPGGQVDQCTIRGKSNWIYARVHNSSSISYSDVTVNFYLANFEDLVPSTEFQYPVDWNPNGLLGSCVIQTVPGAISGNDGTAIAKIEWTSDKIPMQPAGIPVFSVK